MTVATARGATAARAAPHRAQGGARAAPRRQATRAQLLEFKGSDAAAPPIGALAARRRPDAYLHFFSSPRLGPLVGVDFWELS